MIFTLYMVLHAPHPPKPKYEIQNAMKLIIHICYQHIGKLGTRAAAATL